MTKFALKIILLTPIILVMVLINYTVDPGLLFRSDRYVNELVTHLSSGKNIWGLNPNHDERLKQILMLKHFAKPKDIVVFGSSRCKGIHQGLFPEKTFYNAGVSAGSLEDFIGIYQIFLENNILPEILIIELSAWVLNPYNELLHPHVTTLAKQYHRGLKRLGLPEQDAFELSKKVRDEGNNLSRYMQLVSPAYLQQSLSSIAQFRKSTKFSSELTEAKVPDVRKGVSSINFNRFEFYFTDEILKNEFILFNDGSWISSEEERIVTRTEAIQHSMTPKGLYKFDILFKDRVEQFERFVEQILADGVKVIFYLPPWPPITYKLLVKSEKYRIIVTEEEYFRSFALKKKIPVFGSYNSSNNGYTLNDFADSEHLRRSAISKSFKQFWNNLNL